MQNEGLQPDESTNQAEARALDEAWYKRYLEVAAFTDIEFFDDSAEKRLEARRQFETGEIENPVFDYPKLQTLDFSKMEKDLEQLKEDVLAATSTEIPPQKFEVLKQVYRWRLNEKIAELRLMKAARDGEAQKFSHYSDFVYGRPTPEITGPILDSIIAEATDQKSASNPVLSAAAHEVLSLTPKLVTEYQESQLPDQQVFQAAKKQTEQDLENLFAISLLDNSPETVKRAMEEALQASGAEGWTVVISPDIANFSVLQPQKVVRIPTIYSKTVEQCRQMIVHEIGTHVARRINGERSKLKLLGLGLDRYLRGEEGVATLREQVVVEPFKDFVHYARYLAIALAKGVDGTPRDFRQTYSILYPVIRFRMLLTGKSEAEATEAARDQAWTICFRTFRGTDAQTPGKCYTKDMVYREGNIAVWDLVGKDPAASMRFNFGKFDATNPRHLWILSSLEIFDADLKQLD